jgi:hypothetical protein
MEEKINTQQMTSILLDIQSRMATKDHFEILQDAIGDLSEQFTILEQKFIFLRQYVTHA